MTADGGDVAFLKYRGAPGAGFYGSAFVLFDEISGYERFDLVGPFHDAVGVFEGNVFVGIQVKDETVAWKFGMAYLSRSSRVEAGIERRTSSW